MKKLSDYDKQKALNPEWDKAIKVHDWRNYISDDLKAMWETFTDIQKFAIMDNADNQASCEH